MVALFGYLVFMIVYKWLVYGPHNSQTAPSILIHFINMFLFSTSAENTELYTGQHIVQMVLVILALCSVPVLLFGKPLYLFLNHRLNSRIKSSSSSDRRPLLSQDGEGCINAVEGDVEEGGSAEEEEEEFDFSEVFMHQAIHTIEYCLGCISNTASYLRLWALSLAHAQLSEVL
ncbi:UNVERIFIED_CONTAM: hypothetical protein FKN15_029483 [Acipenser sinensis]